MDTTQTSTAATSKLATISSNLCFELIDKILSFLPRPYVDNDYDAASDSNLSCSRVCVNWLTVARRFAFWVVWLRNEEEARRFLAMLISNDAFADRNPGWPRMNSTKVLCLVEVSGLF
jgi:hypothetical protein